MRRSIVHYNRTRFRDPRDYDRRRTETADQVSSGARHNGALVLPPPPADIISLPAPNVIARSEIWQRLIYDQAYDTGDIPPGGQVVVAVDMKVNRVGNLNPSAGVAEMQVTLRTKWTDKRLAWNAITTRSGPEKDLDGLLTVVMSKPDEAKDLIWRPDVSNGTHPPSRCFPFFLRFDPPRSPRVAVYND